MNKIPYFETKVVKVKKVNKCKHNTITWFGVTDKSVICKDCGKLFGKNVDYKDFIDRSIVWQKQLKGNWVNGENLDKIKFPCFCSFDANKGMFGDPSKSYKVHGIGKIDLNYTEGQRQYQLSWADHQQKDLSVLCETPSLKRLIEIYDIHILKGKIIIFEEE